LSERQHWFEDEAKAEARNGPAAWALTSLVLLLLLRSAGSVRVGLDVVVETNTAH